MNKSILEALKEIGSNNIITDAGQYWSEDNARFEQTNPGLLARAGRALNPMTSLGSAMGAMQDGASKGSFMDMGLAALQALPIYGASKAVAPTMKEIGRMVPSLGRTGILGGLNLGSSMAIDEAQAKAMQAVALAEAMPTQDAKSKKKKT